MAPPNEIRLGRNDSLEGKLVYEGGLRVQGTLRGEASVTLDILIDRSAIAEARLEGDNVEVRGRVLGDVVARGRLLLAASAVLAGDVTVARIAIEDGATLNGRVTMGGQVGPEGMGAQDGEAEGGEPAESESAGGQS